MRRPQVLVLLLFLLAMPRVSASQPRAVHTAVPSAPVWGVEAAAPSVGTTSAWHWSRERRKRFQEVAMCALSGGNVTYLLLTGISGPAGVIGFAASLVGVIVCL